MSYLIDQEAWLAYYAERLGVSPETLGERDIRLGLALYHAAYLPTAATIELRHNELDLETRYAEFGFTPNAPSFATAKVRVQVQAAPATNYTLAAPFVVTQGDKRFIATEPLVVPAGQTIGMAAVKAELQGAEGTPQEAAAVITVAVGWLRGAAITLTDVTPGRDGDDLEAIAADFRAYAFNPQALVRAEDHAAFVTNNNATIGRALFAPRTEVTFSGTYSKTPNVPGHLTLALIGSDGSAPAPQAVTDVKNQLLGVTVPYGATALHVVPAAPASVAGSINAVIQPGRDQAAIKEDIVIALESFLSWRSWPDNRHVRAGDIWGAVAEVPGVRYVTSVTVVGKLLGGSGSTSVVELEPWEYPVNNFTSSDLTLTE